jgi:hypothetical protein
LKPQKDFKGSILKVPELTFGQSLKEQLEQKKAFNHIGDYVPWGFYCSTEEIKRRYL